MADPTIPSWYKARTSGETCTASTRKIGLHAEYIGFPNMVLAFEVSRRCDGRRLGAATSTTASTVRTPTTGAADGRIRHVTIVAPRNRTAAASMMVAGGPIEAVR